MDSAEPFGISTHTLASQSPYIHVESDFGIWSQLMKINVEFLQYFTTHFIQGEPKPNTKETFENYHFIILRFRDYFITCKPYQLIIIPSKITKFFSLKPDLQASQ
jgi:hypothetical protein